MIKLLNKYKKHIIALSFAYIYLVFVLVMPSGITAVTPGYISKVEDEYQITDKQFTNNINTIAVYSWHELSVFQKWIASYNDKYDLRQLSEYESTLSTNELRLQGMISNESSHYNAIITAYEYASYVDSNITITYELQGISVYADIASNIQIGDVITKVNGVILDKDNYFDVLISFGLLANDKTNLLVANKDYDLTIISDNNEKTVRLNKNERLIFYPNYQILQSTPKITVNMDARVGGPSGGMMQTLSIYTSLLQIDLKQLLITGTGTIVTNENSTVGEIGGIRQKFYTVLKAKADYFIIPKSQYKEIADLVTKYQDNKIKVIQVENFNDVIELFLNEVK